MRRKDMEPGVLYAISLNGTPRPGLVLDAGQPPNKCRVKVYWKWPGDEQEWLNPNPDITSELAKCDIGLANTNEVIELWSEYCERVLADRAAILAKRQDEDAERERVRQERVTRTEAVLAKLQERGFSDERGIYTNLSWAARNASSRWTSNEFSACDVVELLEFLLLDTEVSQ